MTEVQGTVAEGLESVRTAFEEGFTQRADLGGSFSARRNGEAIVDLWGGIADADTDKPWEKDTVSMIFSGTKGMAAFCVLQLLDKGHFTLDTPVKEVWPGFGESYEEEVLIRHIADHTAGLPGIREPLTIADLTDNSRMIQRMAEEKPYWTPGTVLAYHALTAGWLSGGIVKSVDGRSIGQYFQEEFAQPLGIDAWIGFPSSEVGRLAMLKHSADWPPSGPYDIENHADPDLLRTIVDNPAGRHGDPIPWNDPTVLEAEMPAITGVSNARSMARLYDVLALDGTVDGRTYLSPEAVKLAGTVLAEGNEWITGMPWIRGFGFFIVDLPLSQGTVRTVGHPGAGGSLHGYIPELGVTFSYVMNEIRPGTDTRGFVLLDALYNAAKAS